MGIHFGIVFSYRQRLYKLVDVECGKDNSFYFLPYSHDHEITQRLTSETSPEGHLVLSIDEVRTNCFPVRKLSRHASGFLHSKDTIGSGGRRERDGIQSVPLSQVDSFHPILVICPQAVDTMVCTDSLDPRDLTINLPDSVDPFTVQLLAWNKNCPLSQLPALATNMVPPLGIEIDDKDCNLVLAVQSVAKSSADSVLHFPARTCYIMY